jgi:hypothetical protein
VIVRFFRFLAWLVVILLTPVASQNGNSGGKLLAHHRYEIAVADKPGSKRCADFDPKMRNTATKEEIFFV